MYKEKIEDTKREQEKVRASMQEHQALEQRLLGRLITLQELQDELDKPVAADSEPEAN